MRLLLTTIYILIVSLPCYAANYTLEIIQPRAGLDTTNRYYKAYPGLEYNVRMAVIGGEYPYTYSLTTAPTGMTINSATGEITWPNPTTSGSPHSVTAKVVDFESSEQSVSWTITVTTSGFRFIDANTSSGGDGTISSPWDSLVDMYEGNDYASKRYDSYAGEFLYFKSGTYNTNTIYYEDGAYAPFVEYDKPLVWLAYPGETPIIDETGNLYFYAGSDNLYLDGLTIQMGDSLRGIGIRIESSASNVTIRNCTFDGEGWVAQTGYNHSLIMIEHSGAGSYWSLQDNIASDVQGIGGYWLLGYTASKVLIENNTISDISSHPIGPKEGTNMWFVRGNCIYNCDDYGINVQYSNSDSIDSGNIEILYNYINIPGNAAIYLNSNKTTTGDPMYVYRNTIVGTVTADTVTTNNGPFYFEDNVIINASGGDGITEESIADAERLVINTNLSGTTGDGIIDSVGLLETAYSAYVGTRGWQFSDGSTPIDGSYEPPEEPTSGASSISTTGASSISTGGTSSIE